MKKVIGLLCVWLRRGLHCLLTEIRPLCAGWAGGMWLRARVRKERPGLEVCTAHLSNCGSVMRQHQCSALYRLCHAFNVVLRTWRTAGDSGCVAAPLPGVQVCGTLRSWDCQLCSLPHRTLRLLALIRGWASVLWYTTMPFESHSTFDLLMPLATSLPAFNYLWQVSLHFFSWSKDTLVFFSSLMYLPFPSSR